MTTRAIASDADLDGLVKLLRARKRPFTVEVVDGKRRSTDQNRLQRRLLAEIAEQTGQDVEDVRAYAKLVIGIPILRAESELFAERYDATVKGLPYETKLALMREPLDLPVTRLMSTAQKTRFLDEVFRHFAERGVVFSADREAA